MMGKSWASSKFLWVCLLLSISVFFSRAEAAAPGFQLKSMVVVQFIERAATRDTLNQLRRGGFALYLRHGPTDNSRPDRVPTVDLNDCSTQRPLSLDGRKLMRQVGLAMRQVHIPIEFPIHVSPMCRAKDTAEAAFPGKPMTLDPDLMYTANLTDAQKAPVIANTRRLLSSPVARGGNRLVVAHGPNLMDVMGYFPREATLVIFRPRGDSGFDYVASISPGLWSELLASGDDQ